jgi:DNA modification methylase
LEDVEVWIGDCIVEMNRIADRSVDLILADLPYGTTKCKWDIIIPFDELWKQYNRIIKENAAIVLFGSEPFSSLLRISNIKCFRYDWIWDKKKGANIAQSGFQPLKVHETISVFSIQKHRYFPQKVKLDKPQRRHLVKLSLNRKDREDAGGMGKNIQYSKNYEPDKKLPISIQSFSRDNYKGNIFHPTQKPLKLLEYLIKTYTLENELVLDNAMGSGSTIVAAQKLCRKAIGIEKEEKYFKIAQERIFEQNLSK